MNVNTLSVVCSFCPRFVCDTIIMIESENIRVRGGKVGLEMEGNELSAMLLMSVDVF